MSSGHNILFFDQSKNEQISLLNEFKKIGHYPNKNLSNDFFFWLRFFLYSHLQEINAENLIPFRVFDIANLRELKIYNRQSE
jgi:hypothetical protein